MRRAVLLLCLLLPLAACGDGAGSGDEQPGMPTCYYGAGGDPPVLPSTYEQCQELNGSAQPGRSPSATTSSVPSACGTAFRQGGLPGESPTTIRCNSNGSPALTRGEVCEPPAGAHASDTYACLLAPAGPAPAERSSTPR